MVRNLCNKLTKKNKRIKYRKTNKRGGVGSAEKKLHAERLAASKQKVAESLAASKQKIDNSLAKLKNSMLHRLDSETAHKATSPIRISPPPSKAVPIEVYPDYETLAKEMKEIVTADELEKYLLSSNWLRPSEHYTSRQSFDAGMKIFRQMKTGEKVVWELGYNNRVIDGIMVSRNSWTTDGYNILLTNNGKILCLVNTNANDINPFQTENHDFWIPPECIDTIKILFKNMQNIIYKNETGTRINSFNFQAIYENLNDWLRHIKSTIIKKS